MPKRKPSPENVQETLERKYSRLESTLIAALLSDIDVSKQSQLDDLHATLSALSLTEDDGQPVCYDPDQALFTSSGSISDLYNDSSSSHPTSLTSSNTTSSLESFSTPLGFLQNLFPHLPSSTLQSNLDEHGEENLDRIVENLLSDDYIREIQESDIDRQVDQTLVPESIVEWTAVTKSSRVSTPSTGPPTSRQKGKGKKKAALIIGDVRHRHLAPSRSVSRTISAPVVDPWNYIDSLATRLADILPNIPATVFSSAFHNPQYSNPSAALRSTLASIGSRNTVDDFALTSLLSLLDANSEDIADASLCLQATGSQPDDAFHLVEILSEVDARFPVVMHTPSSPVLSVNTAKRVPAAPPETPPPPARRASSLSPTSPLSPKSPLMVVSPTKPAWGTVPFKVKAKAVPYSHGASIPGSSSWTVVTNGVDDRLSVNEGDAAACLEEAAHWKDKRHTALQQASHLFSRQKHEHGREGALYYSQQAQLYAKKEREWKMKAAKAGVKTRQEQSNTKAIDLHGLTVNQSLEIVKEAVNAWWSSAGAGSKPTSSLEIITGQGRHSKGNMPVIAPAVMKLLDRDGWRAHKRDGTVYVTGVKA